LILSWIVGHDFLLQVCAVILGQRRRCASACGLKQSAVEIVKARCLKVLAEKSAIVE
jgi:hypothetical protein